MSNINHAEMAARVRKYGPAIYDRLIADKRRRPLKELSSMYLLFTPRSEEDFERRDVLELRDIYSALQVEGCTYKRKAPFGSDFSAEEGEVLRYLRDNIRRVGQVVGTYTAIGPRVATSSPYYAVSIEDLTSYDGQNRNPGAASSVVRDNAVDSTLVGLASGILALAFAMALFSGVPALKDSFVGYLLVVILTVGSANVGYKAMRARSPSRLN
jgi:hypothetical protein